jgi:hypothetical protein
MNVDSVLQLASLARLPAAYRQAKHGDLSAVVQDLQTKIGMLAVASADVQGHLAAHIGRPQRTYELEPRIMLLDTEPQLRLQLALESVANGIYSMCEVAAHLVWCIEPQAPRDFHTLADNVKEAAAEPYMSLGMELGDLAWYHEAREIRTEWTHHSPSFVGGRPGDDPIIIVRARRRKRDRVVVKDEQQIKAGHLPTLAGQAQAAMQSVARYVLGRLVANIDPEETVRDMVFDQNGWPRMRREGGFVLETVKMGDVLKRTGLA